MTTTKTTTTIRNINPLTVDVPADLVASFVTVSDDADKLRLSTKAMRQAAEKAGIKLTYFAQATKDSTPEHRYGYAILQRLAVEKQAALLGVTAAAFEPVFNSAVTGNPQIEIGDERRSKKEWKSKLSNLLRPVKDAWVADVRADVVAKRQAVGHAEDELKALMAEAAKTEATSKDAETAVADATAKLQEVVAAHDAATGKEKAKLAAHVKVASKAAEDALSFATMVEEADTAALLAVAEQKEAVEELKAELKEKQDMLPQSRGAQNRKTDSEAMVTKLDALIKTLSDSDGTGYGNADLADAIFHLKEARACFK